jgi:hypothetical protein
MISVCGDVFHVSMNLDPNDEEGPCESGCVWPENDMNRYRGDCENWKERQKETCVVDSKGDRETCK